MIRRSCIAVLLIGLSSSIVCADPETDQANPPANGSLEETSAGEASSSEGSSADTAEETWWSLLPVLHPTPPSIEGPWSKLVRSPVDAFVFRALQKAGLQPSPEASPAVLIRRLYYDVLGLPPSPEDIARFVKNPSPLAYERLVDRVLSSPQFGERWARHWLDVVHYGDTHGYDKDKLRPNAWPYRDYVIRAFNDDKPYSRFVREQVAGDVLWPGTRDGIVATGFISAGPWDFIGHAEVPESKIDGRIARHLDRDDMVANVMNSFTSMTVQCARCHDHKFDPVSQDDYYSLQAVFAALDRADRDYPPSEDVAATRRSIEKRIEDFEAAIARGDREIRQAAGADYAAIDEQIARHSQGKRQPVSAAFGYHSDISSNALSDKWIQVDLGESVELSEVVIIACHDTFANIGAGFGFPHRFRIEVSDDPEFKDDVSVLRDEQASDFPNPGVTPVSSDARDVRGRYVRVTATKLATRSNDYIFALAELLAIDKTGKNRARGKPVNAQDNSIMNGRWHKRHLVDGYYMHALEDDQAIVRIAKLQSKAAKLLERVAPDIRSRQQRIREKLKRTRADLAALPKMGRVYAGTIHKGGGAFRGTGHDGGKPRKVHVLHRGNITSPGDLSRPGTVRVIPKTKAKFDLASDHSEGDRRIALAEWLVRDDHPLTWRSIVNRVWLYHFGRGIVDSPNDFGRMGKKPSHPELLDWLASELKRDQSLKSIHRQILLSHTYKQSSDSNAEGLRVDSGNTFLWRMNRRRLDAEALRDTALSLSGKLNNKMGGPGFWTFVLERPEHSPHYQYHKLDPHDARTHRRSVYRFLVRSQQDPFMETLDCADPSVSVEKRAETLTALQALSLLNDRFMVAMSASFAQQVAKQAPTLDAQIKLAYLQATGTAPSSRDLDALRAYAAKHGLNNTCRVILNLNATLFVD